MIEDDLPDDDPDVEYWIPFVNRMKNIPTDYQLAIIDEYEIAEKTGKDINVEKMWDLLLAGEDEARMTVGGVRKAN